MKPPISRRLTLWSFAATAFFALVSTPAPAQALASAEPLRFKGDLTGLSTHISAVPSPHPLLHETGGAGAYVALVPVRFDADWWRAELLAQWPVDSAAFLSCFQRITAGPAFTPAQALAAV